MKKVALITGSYKGIGFETAKQLGQNEFIVIVSARKGKRADEAAERLKAEGIEAFSVKLDITDEKEVDKACKYIAEKFGKLDVLVNNAGIQLDNDSPNVPNSVETVSHKILKETFESNFFGVVGLTQKLLPLIVKSEQGRIVNVSSIMGSLTMHADKTSPIFNLKPFAYDASKTALNQFTVHLAAALDNTKVKVNSAHPGWVKTDLGGENAPMTVEDGAKSIVELCMIDENGPNGGFFHMGKPLPW
ncbi:MAG: SDR family oxidoreductase [Bacteroidota bacterium]|nr:SDR family oxidoreductase [Bacteroidota bacterium]